MELKFKSEITDRANVDLFAFNEVVDKEYDYINYIRVEIDWTAIIYTKQYGITSNFPSVNSVTLAMSYDWQSQKDDDEYGVREYDLVIDDFDIWKSKSNDKLPYDEKKRVMEIEYNERDESDTHLFPTDIDIDFETKIIEVKF
mgnify:CR=1 FL=1